MTGINKTPNVVLRKTESSDLEALFLHQLDNESAYMAAFVNEKWNDKNAYLDKWNKLLADNANIRTIIADDKIAGSVSTWLLMDELQISYGLGKEYWHRGIATNALQQFLAITKERPLYGRVAFDNIGSAKVLMKCGFRKIGEDKFYAFARKQEIVEFIYLLDF